MTSIAERFKPTASRRTMLFAAGLTWTVMGSVLLGWALIWLVRGEGVSGAFLLPLFAGIGLIKSRLVLDKVARKIAARIEERGDGRCLGGFISPQSWVLVGLMMAMGMVIRRLGLPYLLMGSVYAAVGSSLVVSGRVIWRQWRYCPEPSAGK